MDWSRKCELDWPTYDVRVRHRRFVFAHFLCVAFFSRADHRHLYHHRHFLVRMIFRSRWFSWTQEQVAFYVDSGQKYATRRLARCRSLANWPHDSLIDRGVRTLFERIQIRWCVHLAMTFRWFFYALLSYVIRKCFLFRPEKKNFRASKSNDTHDWYALFWCLAEHRFALGHASHASRSDVICWRAFHARFIPMLQQKQQCSWAALAEFYGDNHNHTHVLSHIFGDVATIVRLSSVFSVAFLFTVLVCHTLTTYWGHLN